MQPPPELSTIRLPLRTGISLWRFLVWGWVAQQLLLMAAYATYRAFPGQLGYFLTNATVLFITPLLIGLALRHRANDAILSPKEIAIVGGRHHGFRLDWSAIEADASRVETVKGRHTLVLHAGYGTRIELASSRSEHELRSLRSLLGSIQTWDRRAEQRADQHDGIADGPQIISCARCGSQVAPSEQAQVSCMHCAAPVVIPKPVRELVRVAREGELSDPLPERAVRSLLVLPTAYSTNLLLFGLCAYAYCIAPLSLGSRSPSVAFVAYVAVVALVLAARMWLVDRCALQVVTLQFGARPPLHRQAPHGCRLCGAPLPISADAERVVYRCIYCRADNILGLEFASGTVAAHDQQKTLKEALRFRQRDGWTLCAILSAFVLLALILLATGKINNHSGWTVQRLGKAPARALVWTLKELRPIRCRGTLHKLETPWDVRGMPRWSPGGHGLLIAFGRPSSDKSQIGWLAAGASQPIVPLQASGSVSALEWVGASRQYLTAESAGGIHRIVLRSVDDRGSNVLRVLAESTAPMSFSISRDGTRIAREQHGSTATETSVVIEDDHGAVLARHPEASAPVLSPDGKRFVVLVKSPIDPNRSLPNNQLRWLDAQSGMVLGSHDAVDCESPRWNPGGTRVALACSDPNDLRLFSLNSVDAEYAAYNALHVTGYDWKDDSTLVFSTSTKIPWQTRTALYELTLDASVFGAERGKPARR